MLKNLKFDAFESPSFAYGNVSRTSSDARCFFVDLCVYPHPWTHNILASTAHDPRRMADLSDYNVAHNGQNNPEFCRQQLSILTSFGAL